MNCQHISYQTEHQETRWVRNDIDHFVFAQIRNSLNLEVTGNPIMKMSLFLANMAHVYSFICSRPPVFSQIRFHQSFRNKVTSGYLNQNWKFYPDSQNIKPELTIPNPRTFPRLFHSIQCQKYQLKLSVSDSTFGNGESMSSEKSTNIFSRLQILSTLGNAGLQDNLASAQIS